MATVIEMKTPQSTPLPPVVAGNKFIDPAKVSQGMEALGRNPQITRDGRIEGVDYNIPQVRQHCSTKDCTNWRKLKGLKKTGSKRRVYFRFCTKCLMKHRGHSKTLSKNPK